MRFERAAGALLGLAFGDALGAPLEGARPPLRKVTEMQGGGIHHVRPGQYTDDTLQACALAQSLIHGRGFAPADFVSRLIRGYHAHPEFYGPTSRRVLDLIETGVEPEAAARAVHEAVGGSRSNGSVMRGVSIGIFYRPALVRDVSMACSRLTHYDPVAGESSAFINRMVSELSRGASRGAAYERALAACRSDEVAALLGAYGRHPLVPSLDAVLCTHCAVAVFMRARNAAEAVITAVNLGGDADTVGAVTGALAGAAWGSGAFPLSWHRRVENREQLIGVARALSAVSMP
ncbi:crystallin [Methanoculleus taiwanensis]|uniref:Crystallin n=1 Tax=Methanoculleus taiwanensis TaxID=1550565 RepID=A0A498H699_9EURY|nr:ADP-ribosylglycohydrolase family protein [Methanoculleus taiwanensis]RXE57196.1 crystallin [Methanoculleus taiwanensis]